MLDSKMIVTNMMIPYFYAGLLGACTGSFLNVVIHRLPKGLPVVRPRSCCPACGHSIAWWDNVPVLSYLRLRGQCRACQARIPASYPLIEAGTAVLFVGLLYVFGWSGALVRYGIFALLLLAAAEIDRRHGIVPNRLVLIGIAAGLVLNGVFEPDALAAHALAACASGGLLWAVRQGSRLVWGRVGMGMGDVKLAAMMGLYLGWDVLWTLYLAVLLGGSLGLAGLATGHFARTTRLPFAPFMALAAGLHLAFPLSHVLLWLA